MANRASFHRFLFLGRYNYLVCLTFNGPGETLLLRLSYVRREGLQRVPFPRLAFTGPDGHETYTLGKQML